MAEVSDPNVNWSEAQSPGGGVLRHISDGSLRNPFWGFEIGLLGLFGITNLLGALFGVERFW